jgi:DNA-binding response OmpR family regulator
VSGHHVDPRSRPPQSGEFLLYQGLRLDRASGALTLNSSDGPSGEIQLSPRAIPVMEALLEAEGDYVTSKHINARLGRSPGSSSARHAVARLRRTLQAGFEDTEAFCTILSTVGRGYYLSAIRPNEEIQYAGLTLAMSSGRLSCRSTHGLRIGVALGWPESMAMAMLIRARGNHITIEEISEGTHDVAGVNRPDAIIRKLRNILRGMSDDGADLDTATIIQNQYGRGYCLVVPDYGNKVSYAGLTLNSTNRTLTFHAATGEERSVTLSPLDTGILAMLIAAEGDYVSTSDMTKKLHGFGATSRFGVLMGKLRKRLSSSLSQASPSTARKIINSYGRGYALAFPEVEEAISFQGLGLYPKSREAEYTDASGLTLTTTLSHRSTEILRLLILAGGSPVSSKQIEQTMQEMGGNMQAGDAVAKLKRALKTILPQSSSRGPIANSYGSGYYLPLPHD